MSDTDSAGSGAETRPSRRAVLRRSGALAVSGAATVGSTALAGCVGRETGGTTGGDGDRDTPDPPLIAHRGFAAENPENTVAAVEAATATTDRLELDVRRCGTGELVAFHDATLGRVTDASGRVSETPYERLAGLSVEGSGEPVPTLAAALDAVPADAWLILELKERGVAADAVAAGADREFDLAVTADDPAVIESATDADSPADAANGTESTTGDAPDHTTE